MKNEVYDIVKSLINDIYAFGKHFAEVSDINPEKVKIGIQLDFIHFALYLAMADGELTKNECDFVKDFFEIDLPVDGWKEYITDLNFDINEVKNPVLFESFVEFDNFKYKSDNTVGSLPECLIFCYKSVGELFFGTGSGITENEIDKLSNSIDAMQLFYEIHTDRTNVNKPASIDVGFIKNLISGQPDLKKDPVVKNEKEICVKFLGKEYLIPDDAITFLQCRDFTSEGLIKLTSFSKTLMDEYKKIGSERAMDRLPDDAAKIQQLMQSIIQDVYNDLIEREIFDVDEFEFSERFNTINEVENLARDVMTQALEAALEIQSENQELRNYAYNAAASNITGSGVRMYTSSFSSFLISSAIENSVLKSQARKADREYDEALRRISVESDNKFNRIKHTTVFERFLPALPKIFIDFNDELMNNYFLELSMHNQINFDNIEKYSENKSLALLENIQHTDDKKKMIIQAFEECPFNIEVYEKILELGYFDVDTIKDAKKIFGNSSIEEILEKYIIENFDNLELIKDGYVSVLAYYKNEDEKTILEALYQDTINKIKNAYNELLLLCTDDNKLNEWIQKNISSFMDKVIVVENFEVEKAVNLWINKNLWDDEFKKLFDMQLMTISDICLKDSNAKTLEEVKSQYADMMILNISDYIKRAKVRKKIYEEAYEKFNDEVNIKQLTLNEKINELKQQALFAFAKKKEIKNEIKQLQSEIDNLKKNEPINLKMDYYGKFN